jgi:hypothetical protein
MGVISRILEIFSLDSRDFADIGKQYNTLMSLILLWVIWMNWSDLENHGFVNTIVMEVGNDLINMARQYVDWRWILKSERVDSLRGIDEAGRTLRIWKKAVEVYSNKVFNSNTKLSLEFNANQHMLYFFINDKLFPYYLNDMADNTYQFWVFFLFLLI